MAAQREVWHNSELRTMVLFMHDFLSGRYDKELRNVGEREKAKTQPSGNKTWIYLERLQQFYDEWDLPEIHHPTASCQSKWSKYLQTRLHDVEGVPPEKVMFIYCKLGTKLTKEATQRITRQYPAYELIWRNDVLKDYKKKFNLLVETRRAEMENEENKRKQREKREMEKRTAASSSDGGPIERSSDNDVQLKRREEERIDRATSPPSPPSLPISPRTARRQQKEVKSGNLEAPAEEKRKEKTSTTVVRTVKMEEPDVERKPDLKPDVVALFGIKNPQCNIKKTRFIPKPFHVNKIEEPGEEAVVGGSTLKSTVGEKEKSIDGGGRREESAEENVAAASAATPLVAAASAAVVSSLVDPTAPSEASKRTVSAESMEEVWEGMERVDGATNEERDGDGEGEKGENGTKKRSQRTVIVDSSCGHIEVPSDEREGDTVAVIYEQVATRSDDPTDFQPVGEAPMEETTVEEAAAVVVGERGNEEEERMEAPQLPTVVASLVPLLGGRPTPAALVARLDRPEQSAAAAGRGGGVSIGFKQRSEAARNALKQAAFDAQPQAKKRPINEPQQKRNEEETKKKKRKVQDTAAAESDGMELQSMERGEGSKQLTVREKLLQRMKKRQIEKKEGEAETLRKMMCESRAADVSSVISREEATLAVLFNENGEEMGDKRLWLAKYIEAIKLQEDPEVKETMRRKLCGENTRHGLERRTENGLDEESLWE